MNFANIINACKQKCLKLGVAGLVGGLVTFGAFLYLTNKFIITPVANIFHKSEVVEMPFGKIDFRHEVKGKDLPCIGKPKGYMRVFRAETKESISLAYAKRGNDLDKAYKTLTSKIAKCGYTKKQNASLNIDSSMKESGFSKIKGEEYVSKDGKELQLTVAHFEYNKKTYTLISLELGTKDSAEKQDEDTNDYDNDYNENYNEDEIPDTSHDFANAKDLTPSDSTMEKYNNYFKPIISSIFRAVKLAEYNSLNMGSGHKYIAFTYVVKETITETNIRKLKDTLVAKGYKEVVVAISSTDFTITLKKESNTITLTGNLKSNTMKINIVSNKL